MNALSFKQQFFQAIALRDAAKATGRDYWAQVRKFYEFTKKPASAWTGPDVEAWMHQLHRMEYAHKSRKQAPCALVFCFKHVLKRDVGTLNLPPMPKERQTLREIPTREELGRRQTNSRTRTANWAGSSYFHPPSFAANTAGIRPTKAWPNKCAPL
jgi:Phage integrase, N-terminal SAM-like domain